MKTRKIGNLKMGNVIWEIKTLEIEDGDLNELKTINKKWEIGNGK